LKRAIVSMIAALALLSALAPLTAWQNTPTLGVLPDSGPNLPATCVVGQIYFKTASTVGLNQCLIANTWTAVPTSAGGTVSANNGSAGAIANYAAAGGSTTVGPDSLLTDNGTTLTYTGTGGITVGSQAIFHPPSTYFGQCAGAVASATHTAPQGLGAAINNTVGCSASVTPTTTVYGALVTHSCSLRNLVANSSAAGVSASDGIVTVYVNTSSTALTCTIGTGTSCTDVSHTVAVTAGQRLNVDILAATSGTVADVRVAFDCN
jgi:hypothetical protein